MLSAAVAAKQTALINVVLKAGLNPNLASQITQKGGRSILPNFKKYHEVLEYIKAPIDFLIKAHLSNPVSGDASQLKAFIRALMNLQHSGFNLKTSPTDEATIDEILVLNLDLILSLDSFEMVEFTVKQIGVGRLTPYYINNIRDQFPEKHTFLKYIQTETASSYASQSFQPGR
jgi:hypothetical protein